MFSLLNDHTANTVLYFGLLEVVVVAWFYGVTNFMDNIEEMKVPMPWPLRYFWMGCWSVITPVLCIAIVILRFINNQPDGRDGYTYPPGVQVRPPVMGQANIVTHSREQARSLKRMFGQLEPVGKSKH